MAAPERSARRATGSTMPDAEAGRRASGRSLWLRRAGLAVLVVLVGAGLLNLLGVRSGTARTSEGGIDVRIEHPLVGRPGLAVSWQLRIMSPDGFDEPIVVRQRAAYFEAFDFNGMEPSPSSSTSDGTWLVWEWDAPDTTSFTVLIDSRVEPGVQALPLTAETWVEAEGERVRLSYRTWVAP